jgi:soluble lytic murein transglycosylase-like protein
MKMIAWRFRTPACHLHLLVLTSVVFGFVAKMPAQSLQRTLENGHVVWTNDGPRPTEMPSKAQSKVRAQSTQSARTVKAAQTTDLFYWSNVEKRWKPIYAKSATAMRYIGSRPKLEPGTAPAKGELAEQDPNYSKAAEDRNVSASQIDRYIREAAARHHVDPNLVRALVKVESNFNPNAVSRKGAMGLMQLMPETARQYDVSNPFDAAQNVDAGVRHLKGLLENFGGDVPMSLAAYNAGAGAVQRSGGIPPYAETRNYVKRITNLMGDGPELHFSSSLSFPIHVNRDEHGKLVISNVD